MARIAALAAFFVVATAALAAEPYSWQVQQAKVLPNGGLEWAPRPFAYEHGRLDEVHRLPGRRR